jgi:hypothetical protein
MDVPQNAHDLRMPLKNLLGLGLMHQFKLLITAGEGFLPWLDPTE